MFCSGVSNDLPVVNSSEKWSVWENGSEVVIGLIQESMSAIGWKTYLFAACFRVPLELTLHIGKFDCNQIFELAVNYSILVLCDTLPSLIVVPNTSGCLALGSQVLLFWSVTCYRMVNVWICCRAAEVDKWFVHHASSLFKILLHLLPKHAFKCLQDLIFIVLFKHVSEFGYLFAFLAAGEHFVSVDVELDDLLLAIFKLTLHQLNSTKFIVAFFSLALYLMLLNFCNRVWFAAHIASNFILFVYFHDDFGRRLHQPILALWTLVVISETAPFAEQQATLQVLTFLGIVNNFLATVADKIFVQLVNWRLTQPHDVESLSILQHDLIILVCVLVWGDCTVIMNGAVCLVEFTQLLYQHVSWLMFSS